MQRAHAVLLQRVQYSLPLWLDHWPIAPAWLKGNHVGLRAWSP
jgi:hypothetical protein